MRVRWVKVWRERIGLLHRSDPVSRHWTTKTTSVDCGIACGIAAAAGSGVCVCVLSLVDDEDASESLGRLLSAANCSAESV